jgi:hypothetical protein
MGSMVSQIKEHNIRIIENLALRIIFGPKRDDATGDENCVINSFTYCMPRCKPNAS